MGEAKRRAQREHVTILPGEDPALSEAMEAARTLIAAAIRINARMKDRRLSSALSTAWQLVVMAHGKGEPNDVLNGVSSLTGWALHTLPEAVWPRALDSMRPQILARAADSASAATLGAAPPQGAA